MKSKRMRLHFQDEAPRLGCGERGVKVQVGRKWAYLTERATGIKVRLRLPAFNLLREQSERRRSARR